MWIYYLALARQLNAFRVHYDGACYGLREADWISENEQKSKEARIPFIILRINERILLNSNSGQLRYDRKLILRDLQKFLFKIILCLLWLITFLLLAIPPLHARFCYWSNSSYIYPATGGRAPVFDESPLVHVASLGQLASGAISSLLYYIYGQVEFLKCYQFKYLAILKIYFA